MYLLTILFYIIQAIIAFYLLQPILLVLLCYIKRRLTGKPKPIANTAIAKNYDFAAIVTAHQDTKFMIPLVNSLLQQTHQNFVVYVIADDCDISNIHFTDSRVQLIKPAPSLHSKVKSIDLALKSFVRAHDAMVIFDTDNLAHPNYFEVINAYHNKGYRAVQGNIVAKNLDSLYACMDEAGQMVKTFHDKLSRQELGLSSSIYGLGLSVWVEDYKDIAYRKGMTGGFDKRLQAEIVKKVPKIAFANEAIIYDEKVPDGQHLQKQRTRWIHSHFKNMGLGIGVIAAGLKKLNFNLIYFGIYLLNPPTFILILLVGLMVFINLFISLQMVAWWLFAIFLFIVSFPLILKYSNASKPVMKALFTLPVFMYWQIMALLRLAKAKKDFLKTEHYSVLTVEEVMAAHQLLSNR